VQPKVSTPALKRDEEWDSQGENLEEIIIGILSDVLHIDKTEFAPGLSFQEYGVDSLLAVEIIDKLVETLNVSLRATDLFNFSTIRGLSHHIIKDLGYNWQSRRKYLENPPEETVNFVEPSLDTAEGLIKNVLSGVLQMRQSEFETDVPFVDYGIDSLLAVEIIDKLNEKLKTPLRATDLFNFSTIRGLSSHISGNLFHPVSLSPGHGRYGEGSEEFFPDNKMDIPDNRKDISPIIEKNEVEKIETDDGILFDLLQRLEVGELSIDEVSRWLEEGGL
jgi:acyl carrier protein